MGLMAESNRRYNDFKRSLLIRHVRSMSLFKRSIHKTIYATRYVKGILCKRNGKMSEAQPSK